MLKEADELTAVFIASGKTARQNNPNFSLAKQKSAINVVKLKGSASIRLSHCHFKMRCLSVVEGLHHIKKCLT